MDHRRKTGVSRNRNDAIHPEARLNTRCPRRHVIHRHPPTRHRTKTPHNDKNHHLGDLSEQTPQVQEQGRHIIKNPSILEGGWYKHTHFIQRRDLCCNFGFNQREYARQANITCSEGDQRDRESQVDQVHSRFRKGEPFLGCQGVSPKYLFRILATGAPG